MEGGAGFRCLGNGKEAENGEKSEVEAVRHGGARRVLGQQALWSLSFQAPSLLFTLVRTRSIYVPFALASHPGYNLDCLSYNHYQDHSFEYLSDL